MTQTFTNSRRARARRNGGFTLVEALAVVVIVTVLMSAATVPFVHALNSYKGQYASESSQLEANRMIAEFNSYGRRAVYHELSSSSGSYGLAFKDMEGRQVVFTFQTESVEPDGSLRGVMAITLPVQSYSYEGSWLVPAGGPFTTSNNGVGVYFQVESAGAPVDFQAFIPTATF